MVLKFKCFILGAIKPHGCLLQPIYYFYYQTLLVLYSIGGGGEPWQIQACPLTKGLDSYLRLSQTRLKNVLF